MAAILCGCAQSTSEESGRNPITLARIPTVANVALSWQRPTYAQTLLGARLLRDGVPFSRLDLAVAESVQRDNLRLRPLAALDLVDEAIAAARVNGLDPEFFCATLLQESAFDPGALSSAGAVGIAQFTLATAASVHVDPFDPRDAIRGSAALLVSYVRAYSGIYPDPYAVALAAYNAGPGAVRRYHGIPPYPETREYIDDIYDRWARILGDETPSGRQVRPRAREIPTR